MFSRRRLLAAGALAPVWSLTGRAWGAETGAKPPEIKPDAKTPGVVRPTPPSVNELLRGSVFHDAAISPDGSKIATAQIDLEGGDPKSTTEPMAFITIQDAADIDKPANRFNIGRCTVEGIEWANNERLLIWVAISKIGDRTIGIDFYGITIPIPMRRVIAVDINGKNQKVLFENQAKMLKRTFNAARVVDLLANDDRRVLMQITEPAKDTEALYMVDVYTGEATLLERGVYATDGWYAQNGVPVLRYNSNRRGTIFTIEGRAPGETDWKTVRKIRRDEWSKQDFEVVGGSKDPGVLMVLNREETAQTNALRTFDLKTMTYGPIVAQRADRDIESVFLDETGEYIGASYVADRLTYEFADKALAPHYKGIHKFLGDECCVALTDISRDRNRLLLRVSGPREPGAWYFYDRNVRQIHPLGATKPWLTRERLGKTEALTVKTRDGAQITAYLTSPLTEGPRPLVVMPHGGPEVRDHMDFDLFTQALVAKGWMVLQPNFRGSSGYGRAFADAGRKRWGDRMQEDVEDAVAHVLAGGKADPKKIAICGASYGGYAAQMGVVRGAVPYRRAVSIAGLSDLPDLLKHERREEGADSPTYAYLLRTIGDPKDDAAMLANASPRLRVGEIKVPLMLIHGSLDEIAPYDQSKKMAEALKKAGKVHRFETIPGAGHGGWNLDQWRQILGLTTDFLEEGFEG